MKNNIFRLILSVAATISFASCVDLDTPPMDSDTDLTFWSQTSSALETVNACYQWLGSADGTLYADMATDNGYCKVQSIIQAVGNGSYSTDDNYVKQVWDSRYAGIKMCNRLTDNISKVPGLTDELRNRYLAEARVIRAYHYYELMIRFGDVPYFKHVITIAESASIARTPKSEIVTDLLAELDDVIDNEMLPAKYSAEETGRLTKWAAMALKARILLFEGRWSELKATTDTIMSEGGFGLFDSYEGLFETANENNCEVIANVEYAPSVREHQIQYLFLPPSLGGYSQIAPLQELVDSYVMLNGQPIWQSGSGYDKSNPYADRDPRLAATIVYGGNSYKLADGTSKTIDTTPNAEPDGYGFSSNCSPTGYYIKKYWDNTYRDNLYSGLNIILIRYADILLMNAEAAAQTKSLNAEVWDKTIKPIRQRAGFTQASATDFPTSSTTAQLLETVCNERRSELAFEGLRMADIYRWKKAETLLNGWCHGIYTGETIGTDEGYVRVENRKFAADKNYLWPIPQADRYLNGNLTQNPNW